jgi:hypothetical protein
MDAQAGRSNYTSMRSEVPVLPPDAAPAITTNPASRSTPKPPTDHWLGAIDAVKLGQSQRIVLESVADQRFFAAIHSLEGLHELCLDGGMVPDIDLDQAIEGLQLTHLRVRLVPLDDSDVEKIVATQPKIRILNLPHSRLTHQGFQTLSRLKHLELLRIGSPNLTDEATLAIPQLVSLRSLHLIGPRLGGDSLLEIAKAKNLQSFYLDDCPLPDASWEKMFRERPDLHVHIDQAHHDRDPKRDHQ